MKIDEEERQNLVKREEKGQDQIEEDEEEYCCNCSYKKIWKGYKACLEFTAISIVTTLISIKNCICNCLGCCFFPIKERICQHCDDVDKDLNPYKNPNYNPYDYL
jgi:hypothetical protein